METNLSLNQALMSVFENHVRSVTIQMTALEARLDALEEQVTSLMSSLETNVKNERLLNSLQSYVKESLESLAHSLKERPQPAGSVPLGLQFLDESGVEHWYSPDSIRNIRFGVTKNPYLSDSSYKDPKKMRIFIIPRDHLTEIIEVTSSRPESSRTRDEDMNDLYEALQISDFSSLWEKSKRGEVRVRLVTARTKQET